MLEGERERRWEGEGRREGEGIVPHHNILDPPLLQR